MQPLASGDAEILDGTDVTLGMETRTLGFGVADFSGSWRAYLRNVVIVVLRVP
jgi:hypothetical protein